MVNPDGTNEDPIVKAMLSDEFVHGTNAEATEIALLMQQLIRGQNAMLAQQGQLSEELSQLRTRMNEMDKAAQRWNDDRENFVQEVLDKAESLRATGSAKDKILAQGANEVQAAIAQARAEQATENIRFEQSLATMPKVMVVSAGELVMVVENGRQVAKIMNETVKIKNHKWVLPVGKATEVPLIVAQVLEHRRQTQEETHAREALLASNVESSVLDRKWKEINSKFNSTTDTVPIATA
jgi:hypothetical protein